jgi:excinuclease UvrABC ATPase subunit
MQPTPDNPYAIIVCPRCFGTGYILTRHRETCPDCNGSGRITEVKARELDRQENEAVENALAQRINELEAKHGALASENARLREALALACAALERVQPQTRGALVVEDVAQAISAARRVLDGGA